MRFLTAAALVIWLFAGHAWAGTDQMAPDGWVQRDHIVPSASSLAATYDGRYSVYISDILDLATPTDVGAEPAAGNPSVDGECWKSSVAGVRYWGECGTGSDDQTASEVPTDTANFNGNLGPTHDTVQKALDALDELAGGSGTDDQTAAEVPITDTGAYFTGTEVETALQEIGPTMTNSRTPTSHGNEAHSTTYIDTETDPGVTTHETTYDHTIFMKIHVIAQEPDQTTKDGYSDYTEGYVIQ